MFKNYTFIKLLSLFLVFFLGLYLYNYFLGSKENPYKDALLIEGNEIKEIKIPKNEDQLNEDNYRKIGINPEKYETLSDFLLELKSFSGVLIDPTKENFVVGKSYTGGIMYIQFKQNNIKNDDYNTGDLKNISILDIYEGYKNNSLYGGMGSNRGPKIIFENDVNHSSTDELNKVFSLDTNVNKLIEEMEQFDSKSKNKIELLSYLYDFVGNYDKADNKRLDLCIHDKNDGCDIETDVKFYGITLDQDNNPLSGVKITLLNENNIFTTSGKDGKFELDFKFFPFAHIRFKTSKLGYSDGFTSLSLNSYEDTDWVNEYDLDIHLTKSDANYSVDISDSKYKGLKYYTFESSQSKYLVPVDGLYLLDGTKWKGTKYDVYLYEFTKWDNIDDLVTVDTFNPVYGYVGNLMKTFGMPYIQFIDAEKGDEIFVNKSNPMILQNSIYHMQELYDNHDKIYEAITEEDMQYLVDKSAELGGFPINFEFLTNNDFLRWPAWWALDRKKGIWENVGSRVISTEGLVEIPFYSINDIN